MPRINIALEKAYFELLTLLAEQENTSVSSLAKELILETLDNREDMVLSEIARIRDDVEKTRKIKHEKAWKSKNLPTHIP